MPRSRGGYRGGYRGPRNSQKSHKPPLTHFLCLPLVTEVSRPQLETSFGEFKDQIRDLNKTAVAPAVVPLKAVRPIDTIHLTLGVMSLETEEKLTGAVEFLQDLDVAKILAGVAQANIATAHETQTLRGLEVSVGSLLSMHNPLDTSVLYAAPQDSTERLLPFCEALRKAFVEKGFMVDENRPLRLHATIINTLYAKAEVGTVKRLDATNILAQFIDFKWTESFPVEKVAICKMGAKKVFDDHGVLIREAYEEVVSVELPR